MRSTVALYRPDARRHRWRNGPIPADAALVALTGKVTADAVPDVVDAAGVFCIDMDTSLGAIACSATKWVPRGMTKAVG